MTSRPLVAARESETQKKTREPTCPAHGKPGSRCEYLRIAIRLHDSSAGGYSPQGAGLVPDCVEGGTR